MAALSADRRDNRFRDGKLISYPVKAGKTIYAGAIVELASGYAQPAASGNGKIYVGIAAEAADNSATGAADGGKTVRVRRGVVVFMHVEASDAPAQADVGKDVYVADDHTVKKTKGSNTALGKLVGVESSSGYYGAGCWVLIA